ncbi:MAG TPA: CPBP family intramembrane metalloprotease [Clostridiales bacterium]|nr:CPBP family intramembrane metalloprotease [Clostridiales bacterium]
MKKRELLLIAILTVLIAFMDISGIPSTLLFRIRIADIEPIYFSLMINFFLIGGIAFLYLTFLCPDWKLGLGKEGLAGGLKQYGGIGALVALAGLVAFLVGSLPFDGHPSVTKVVVEGVVYYIGVAVVEELYVRGLLLGFLKRLFAKKNNGTLIAVASSAVVFGVGHIFGSLGQPPLVIVGKVIWTVGMGLFFGMVYQKTGNLWVPILLHFLVNVCALPYQFSGNGGYADSTLYILVPVYLILGIYSVVTLQKQGADTDIPRSTDRKKQP